MEYENISCELTEAFCTRNERSARTKGTERELFTHSMVNLPGRRMFEASTPRNAPPCSRGRSPEPSSVGGLPITSALIQKPPVKVARCQNCINRIIDYSIYQPNPRQLAGDATEPKSDDQSQYSAAVFVPVCSASCNAYLHARSDHSNPKDPTHHPTAATLDPLNALCLA